MSQPTTPASAAGRSGRCSSGPGAACPTARRQPARARRRMALRNARDVYTRRGEGVSIWVVPSAAIVANSPMRRTRSSTPRGQGLPASDLLRRARGGEAPVSGAGRCRRWPPTRWRSATTRSSSPSGSASGRRARRRSRRTSPWPTSRSTCSARRVPCSATPVRSRAPAVTRTTWPTCATSASSATCSWSRSRTATSPSRWSGSWSSPPTSTSSTPPCWAATTPTLAGLAAKAVKEVAYHRDHATQWVLRLGDGTDLSHERMQAGLDQVWPYAEELFDPAGTVSQLPGVAADPATLRPAWEQYVTAVLTEATLRPAGAALALPRRPRRPAHRAPRAPAGRDAAPPPLVPGGDVVSDPPDRGRAAGRRPGRARSRAPRADPRRPGRDPRPAGGRRREPSRSTSPPPTPAARPPRSSRATSRRPGRAGRRPGPRPHGAGAGVDDRLDERGGTAQAAPVRDRPARTAGAAAGPVRLAFSVRCPHCGSPDTREVSRFGSTPCKALWTCRSCAEPFDAFKAL